MLKKKKSVRKATARCCFSHVCPLCSHRRESDLFFYFVFVCLATMIWGMLRGLVSFFSLCYTNRCVCLPNLFSFFSLGRCMRGINQPPRDSRACSMCCMCCIFSTSTGHLHHSLHEIKASLLGKFSRFLCADDDSKLRKSLRPRLRLFPATQAAYGSRKMTSDLHQILILPPAFTCFSDHLPSKYLSSYFKRLGEKKNAMHRYDIKKKMRL